MLMANHLTPTRSQSNDRWQLEILAPGVSTFDFLGSLNYTGPAYETGLQTLRVTYPQHIWNMTYLASPSCFEHMDTVQAKLAEWYYVKRSQRSVAVIVMPGCGEGAIINSLASAWNVLMITSSEGLVLPDPRKRPTWITTTPIPPLPEVYCSFLKSHGWTKVYVFLDQFGLEATYYSYVATRVKGSLNACGVRFEQNICLSTGPGRGNCSLTTTLEDFNNRHRIFLYFGKPSGLRIILIEASRLNMTNGKHVYVAVIPYRMKIYGTEFRWQNYDLDDEVVRQAYQSVILLSLVDESRYTTASMANLIRKWRVYSEQDFSNTHLEFELPLPILIATHAALELVGRVVHELFVELDGSLSEKWDGLITGTQLASRIRNRTFSDLDVGKMHMTVQGHLTFQTHAHYFHNATGQFVEYMRARLTEDDAFFWVATADSQWFNQTGFPSDEPMRDRSDGDRRAFLAWAAVVGIPIGLVLAITASQIMR
ncbi:hypothetical protein BV898_09521 [Hypsibius exemplaris]|uniref:Receptor ligand binding region domain-containing protein n=1 Tax=Hypsibius exemplaris TaxID=2072580 RepID=A0A1W0WMC9_HYPEX|nr:hypothetical protein BV898_09521 [Hypsibius exemplaris]